MWAGLASAAVPDDGDILRKLDATVSILAEAESHGLPAVDLTELRAHRARLAESPRDADLQSQAGTLAQAALLDFALDFGIGRQKPAAEQVETLKTALASAFEHGTLVGWYKSLMPTDPAYHRLRAGLQLLRYTERNASWPTIGTGPTLEPGSTGERVQRLRERLGLSVEAGAAYDDALQEAVADYQARNGLIADGFVGHRTRAHLDVPMDARIRQLQINLERWRETRFDSRGRHVQVNLPSYELTYVSADGDRDNMRVVIGDPDNQTPLFADSIEYLVFSPYWNVPRRIALTEVLPEVSRDPNYLHNRNFEVLDRRTRRPVSAIDWDRIRAGEMPYRLRQKPGRGNALGRVKFILPNEMSIYLHDTAAPHLFKYARRAYSHGCIRVEDPQRLAEWLLADHPEWSPEAISDAMAATAPKHAFLGTPVPVVMTYFTAAVNPTGEISYYDDVYEFDQNHTGRMASTYLRRPESQRDLTLLAATD